jgi:hypothetical protein
MKSLVNHNKLKDIVRRFEQFMRVKVSERRMQNETGN